MQENLRNMKIMQRGFYVRVLSQTKFTFFIYIKQSDKRLKLINKYK